jgi:pimeloyl-ACP methyl ester carboxylesterase
MSALVLDDGVVHYEYYGRGRPLIFIHGWLGSWRYWVPAMDALSEEYKVYALDLWGFGDSDKSQERYDVQSYVDLLGAFIEELGIPLPMPLVGHALGATVALSFARQHPEQIDRVMAVSLPLGRDLINPRALNGGGSILDRVLGRSRSPAAGYDDVESEIGQTAPGAISQSVASVQQLDMHELLVHVRAPVLVVYGEQDNFVTPTDVPESIGRNQSIRTMMLPQCRHFPMLDRSSQFNRLLQDFLKSSSDLNALSLKNEWQRRIR